jgi:hypothetical protein
MQNRKDNVWELYVYWAGLFFSILVLIMFTGSVVSQPFISRPLHPFPFLLPLHFTFPAP